MFTKDEFGQALEIYYKNYSGKQLGRFLCEYFNLNDLPLSKESSIVDACKYFSEKYVSK